MRGNSPSGEGESPRLFGQAAVRLPKEKESQHRSNDPKRAEQHDRDALLRIHFLEQEVLGADHQDDTGKERYEVFS